SPPMVQCYARRRSRRDVSSSRRRPEAREAQRFPGLFICTHAMADLLPVFLTLAGRRVVLVGGGRVAAAKLRPLIDAAADVRRVGVTIAVSTSGEAPALAGLLREALDSVLPDDLAAWMAEARRQRRAWRRAGVPMERRRPLLLAALNRLYRATAETAESPEKSWQ